MMVLHVRLYSNGSKQADGLPSKKQALCKLNHGSGVLPPVRLVSFHLNILLSFIEDKVRTYKL